MRDNTKVKVKYCLDLILLISSSSHRIFGFLLFFLQSKEIKCQKKMYFIKSYFFASSPVFVLFCKLCFGLYQLLREISGTLDA